MDAAAEGVTLHSLAADGIIAPTVKHAAAGTAILTSESVANEGAGA